jgi:hypothetical protein
MRGGYWYAEAEGEQVLAVTYYSRKPGPAVLAALAARGRRLVPITEEEWIDAVTADPAAFIVRDGQLARRGEG